MPSKAVEMATCNEGRHRSGGRRFAPCAAAAPSRSNRPRCPTSAKAPAANGPPAAAQSEREQPPERPAPNDEDATGRPTITIEDAAAIVLQAYGGRVVQQETLSEERGYRIRVDVKGRVKTVFVDLSGRVREQPPRQRDAPADR